MFPERIQRVIDKAVSLLWRLLCLLFCPLLRLLGRFFTGLGDIILSLLPSRLASNLHGIVSDIKIYFNSRNRVFRRSVLASVLIHFVTMICFASIPSCNQPTRWEARPIAVSLVTVPVQEPQTQIVETKPVKPPTQKKKETPKPKPKPIVKETKKKDVPKVVAPKKETSKEPEVEPVTEAPKLPQEEITPPAPTPKAVTPTKQLNATRIDETAFAYDYYLEILKVKISEAWAPPTGQVGLSDEDATILRFRISRNGSVSGFMIEKSSPIFRYDESARQAVVNAQPFPPFPPAFTGQWLTIHMRFELDDWQPAQVP